jgi:hypothetical protein
VLPLTISEDEDGAPTVERAMPPCPMTGVPGDAILSVEAASPGGSS